MSEAKNIAYSTAALLGGRIGSMMVRVGFTIYFAHELTKAEFATLAIFEIMGALNNMLSNFGLETYCLREVPFLIENKERSKAAALIKTAVSNRVICSTAIGLLILYFAHELAELFFKDDAYANVIQILSIGVVMFSINTSMELIANSIKAFKEVAVINFMVTISFCVVSFTLYHFIGFKGWVTGISVSGVVGSVLFFLLLKRWFFHSGGLYPWIKMVRKSFAFYMRGFARFGFVRLDHAVIGIFLTPASLATYYVAKRFPGYISILMHAVEKPLLAKISENKNTGEHVQKLLRKISRYNSFLFIPVCIGVAVFGYPLLEIYGGEKYTDGFIILILLCLSRMVKSVTSSVYNTGLFIIGDPHKTLIVDMTGLLVNLMCLIIFVPLLGTTGVALSVLFSAISSQFSARYLLNKIIPVEFDTKAMYKTLLAVGGGMLAAAFMQIMYYRLYLIPVYFLCSSFIFITIMFNLIGAGDIKFLTSIVPSKLEKQLLRIINFFVFRKKPFSER